MTLPLKLLAAGGDLWTAIIPLIFIAIYVFNHLISQGAAKANPQRGKTVRRPQDGTGKPIEQAQRAAREKAEDSTRPQLNAEIEQFLRRAKGKSSEAPKREPAMKNPARPPQTKKRPSLSQQPRSPASSQQPVDVMPLEPRELSTVGSSVERHLGDRGFSKRAEHLADEIVRADQQMERHLQEAFHRRVGTLGDGGSAGPVTDAAPAAAEEKSLAAVDIKKLLSDRQNIQQAVVLSEILARPEHRW